MPDINLRSFASVNDVEDCGPYPLIADPAIHSDALHFSNVNNAVVKYAEIHGGKEDCIDINNHSSKIMVWRTQLKSQGSYCMTIKGGSRYVTLNDVVITAHGKEADIDLGNWSDQSNARTLDTMLQNVRAEDGKPVIVRVLWADVPFIIGGNIKLVGILPWAGTGLLNRILVTGWRIGRRMKLWGTKP